VLSLRISRDKRGYDHIYLLLETRRKGRAATRLLYGGRWPSPMRIGQPPLDEATRRILEQAHPDVTFDWGALQRTLQQALTTPRAQAAPPSRPRRPGSVPPAGPGAAGVRPGQRGGVPAFHPSTPVRPEPEVPASAEPNLAAVEAASSMSDFVAPDAGALIQVDEVALEQAAEVARAPEAGPEAEIAEIEAEVERTFVIGTSEEGEVIEQEQAGALDTGRGATLDAAPPELLDGPRVEAFDATRADAREGAAAQRRRRRRGGRRTPGGGLRPPPTGHAPSTAGQAGPSSEPEPRRIESYAEGSDTPPRVPGRYRDPLV
jgi:hypothetical protein